MIERGKRKEKIERRIGRKVYRFFDAQNGDAEVGDDWGSTYAFKSG